MNVNLNELMGALPQDDPRAQPELAREELERIFADLAMKPAPTGSLQRLWTVSELSVQVALAFCAHRVRGWFADSASHERQKLETNLRMALKIVHRLSYLRGALMKVGQAVGYFPQILPPELVNTLEQLRFDAPPMHYSLIREVLVNELGAEPEELFQTFEKQAFAAASIGQVHRATLKTGEQVAVKIQYPGIARTIDVDVRNLSALMTPLRLGRNWEGLHAGLEEIQRMLKQESDYLREAEFLRTARGLFTEADGIVVPRLYEQYSGKRVLTMEYLPGLHLRDFLATKPSQELRNTFGTKLCFSWYRFHGESLNYADPHSGNYLFMEDGRLAMLDFGCMQHSFEPFYSRRRTPYDQSSNGPDLAREVLLEAGTPAADLEDENYLRVVDESIQWFREPMKHPGAFDYGDESYIRRRLEWFSRASFHGHALRDDPVLVYYSRSHFALMTLLYHLRAKVDMHTLPFATWLGDKLNEGKS